MSGKRITINKILSNESLSQENQYFQVQEQGWRGRAQGRLCACAHARAWRWGRGAGLMEKRQGLGASGPEGPPPAPDGFVCCTLPPSTLLTEAEASRHREPSGRLGKLGKAAWTMLISVSVFPPCSFYSLSETCLPCLPVVRKAWLLAVFNCKV